MKMREKPRARERKRERGMRVRRRETRGSQEDSADARGMRETQMKGCCECIFSERERHTRELSE